MLPDPTLIFTLPSIHDDTFLDCRIYHPYSLTPSPNAPPWKRHAAIVAHPYAPMGGSYDDPVVDVAGEVLLRAGFLLATFNFRGAGKSAGKTSWTGKPERGDYESVVGFLTYYIHYLDPFHSADPSPPATPAAGTRFQSHSRHDAPQDHADGPVLLCGGYSYGAIVTSQLPPLEQILFKFAEPPIESAPADIRLRAQHLAEQQNAWLSEARDSRTTSPRKHLAVRVGGDEGEQRRSQEYQQHHHHHRPRSPHTEAKLRKGVSELLVRKRASRTGHGGGGHQPRLSRRLSFGTRRFSRSRSRGSRGEESRGRESGEQEQPDQQQQQQQQEDKKTEEEVLHHHSTLEPVPNLTRVRPAYLLISPPQGLVSNLITLSFLPVAGVFSSSSSSSAAASPGKTPSPSPPVLSPAPSQIKNEAGVTRSHLPGVDTDEKAAEHKLVVNPTLAVYGAKDGFCSASKYRSWARRFEGIEGSRFRAVEASKAGHFYAENGAVHQLRDAVAAFAQGMLEGQG